MKAKTMWTVTAALALVCGCGIYTFSGSTLPGHLKTVDIPLFTNESLQPGIAEQITDELEKRVPAGSRLKSVPRNGDATISGKVVGYVNEPYTYGGSGVREVDVSSYVVRIVVVIEFRDNRKDKVLYEGRVIGEHTYDFKTETEQDGVRETINDIIDQILQSSVKGW